MSARSSEMNDWHMNSCQLKYGGSRCTCGYTEPEQRPSKDVLAIKLRNIAQHLRDGLEASTAIRDLELIAAEVDGAATETNALQGTYCRECRFHDGRHYPECSQYRPALKANVQTTEESK